VKFHGSHFENRYHGHHEYIGVCLHILKCLLDDSLHVYIFFGGVYCSYKAIYSFNRS